MHADRLRDLAQQHPAFREQLMFYEQFFLAQGNRRLRVTQSMTCRPVPANGS
jgi:hypothetical protein